MTVLAACSEWDPARKRICDALLFFERHPKHPHELGMIVRCSLRRVSQARRDAVTFRAGPQAKKKLSSCVYIYIYIYIHTYSYSIVCVYIYI